jgi:hypothetical protein
MARPKGYTTEQIILKLREADVLLSGGQTIKQICRISKSERLNFGRPVAPTAGAGVGRSFIYRPFSNWIIC